MNFRTRRNTTPERGCASLWSADLSLLLPNNCSQTEVHDDIPAAYCSKQQLLQLQRLVSQALSAGQQQVT